DTLKEADELYAGYEELFATGDLYITVGNISLKAFGSPAGSVKFSHTSGIVPLDEAVTLSGAEDIFVSINDSEYVPYTEPIEITENTKISAYTDPMVITERTYKPAKADFNTLRYRAFDSGYGSAKKIDDGEYVIELQPQDTAIQLYPETPAKIVMNGKEISPYKYTSKIEVDYGETDITFELEQEDKISDTINLKILKNPVSFNLEKETISFQSGFRVTAEDGTEFKYGDSIRDYAGQNVTAVNVNTSEKLILTVPERAVLPELEYDYYFETLGFIPNETAELLEYSVAENPTEKDYISAENRFVDGTWINSGMVMNKDFKVIPDEKITFRITAGNDMFASEQLKYEIPSAVSAPKEMPKFVTKDGKYYLSGYDYEIALESETDISALAEKWGYPDEESYLSVMAKRYGTDDIEKLKKIVGSEWGTDYALENGQTVAVRYASTDNDFASECKFITVGSQKGDINDDGRVDAVDASLVSIHYASLSTDGTGTIDENKLECADYNGDGKINAVDASEISIYYAKMSTINNE
ncbi:MAG: hypothetical protein K2K66_04405, partial [Ruminococcus sp.]|nr:hypothetical protein [Ruminococcus sp.]